MYHLPVIQGGIYSPEPCCFNGVRGLENHFLLIELMRDKYLLHNINE
jgi:hypothetical protein